MIYWYIFKRDDGNYTISQNHLSFLELLGEFESYSESPDLAFMDWFYDSENAPTIIVTAVPHFLLRNTWNITYEVSEEL